MSSPSRENRVAALEALLPQTQCRQCGQADCRGYAEALASGATDIDRCPPGGDALRDALARVLGLDPPRPPELHGEPREEIARIVQGDCIGCARCLEACPVDAIVGAPAARHAVIASACTGCGLCVPVCPTDCIRVEAPAAGQRVLRGEPALDRYRARVARRTAGTRAAMAAVLVEVAGLSPTELRDGVLEAVRRRRHNATQDPASTER